MNCYLICCKWTLKRFVSSLITMGVDEYACFMQMYVYYHYNNPKQ